MKEPLEVFETMLHVVLDKFTQHLFKITSSQKLHEQRFQGFSWL